MMVKDIIQEEISNLGRPINSKSEYNLSINRCDRMKEQIITHYLASREDPRISPLFAMREEVFFFSEVPDSKTHLNGFLSRKKGVLDDRDIAFFDKLSETLREMRIFRIAFDLDTLEEQNRIYNLLYERYWVPRDMVNLGTNKKPFFIIIFTPYEIGAL